MLLKRISVAVLGSVLAIGVAGPAAAAERPVYMGPQLLEQAVLRAQPGTELGKWTQNLYFRNSKDDSPSMLIPDVCPSRTKKAITLPKAKSFGSVGYDISVDRSMLITMWQYATQEQADAAMKEFEAIVCPDSPRVGWEDGKYYNAEGGSDYTETKVNGVYALAGGYAGTFDGIKVNNNWAVRIVGLTVVKVEISLANESAVYNPDKPGPVDAAGAMSIAWVDAASRAVMKFSGMDARAA